MEPFSYKEELIQSKINIKKLKKESIKSKQTIKELRKEIRKLKNKKRTVHLGESLTRQESESIRKGELY